MRISDWSSDVCSSDLDGFRDAQVLQRLDQRVLGARRTTLGLIDVGLAAAAAFEARTLRIEHLAVVGHVVLGEAHEVALAQHLEVGADRSEEHTSELQSLMRTSYAVFCLKKQMTQHT